MTFKDSPEGQTHSFGDGCIPPHEPFTSEITTIPQSEVKCCEKCKNLNWDWDNPPEERCRYLLKGCCHQVKKASELFEGENSSLRKTFDEVTHPKESPVSQSVEGKNCPECAFRYGEIVPEHLWKHGDTQNDHIRAQIEENQRSMNNGIVYQQTATEATMDEKNEIAKQQMSRLLSTLVKEMEILKEKTARPPQDYERGYLRGISAAVEVVNRLNK